MQVEITPELLAEVESKARLCPDRIWTNRLFCIPEEDGHLVSKYLGPGSFGKTCVASIAEDADYIAAANPAVVLALIQRIRDLEATR